MKTMTQTQTAPGKLEIVRKFLNTWKISHQTHLPIDSLHTFQEMQNFQKTYFPDSLASIEPEMLLQLRSDLRAMGGRTDVEIIKRWLASYPVSVTLTNEGDTDPIIAYQPAGEAHSLCTEILAVVIESIALHQWMRLKSCPDCQWFFYDQSKNASKVWCGMLANGPTGRACGSIAKVRRWRERHQR